MSNSLFIVLNVTAKCIHHTAAIERASALCWFRRLAAEQQPTMNNQTLYTKVGSICGLLCCYTSGKKNIKNKKSKYSLECTLCVRYKAQICIDAPNVPEEGQQQRDSPNRNRELVFVIILVFFFFFFF